jgi:L-gulonate 5-dehydrogenase
MKAAVLEKYRKFSWQEVPLPTMGESDVLVQVTYAGICGSDMHIYNGDFQPRTHTPMIPGHEFTGIVADVGSKVHTFSRGEKVAVDPIIWCGKCAPCQIGRYPACTSLKLIGVDMNGGFAEYVVVKESMLYKLPESIMARHAALIEVYSVGFHAINRAGLQENDTVAIWGTGRIGHSLLQAARTKTHNAIFCIDIIESRLQMAKMAYPDIVTINATKQDPVAFVKEKTNGRGVDVAFEAVGHARNIPKRPNPVRGCIQCIRGAGTVCVLGLGEIPTPILLKELIWKEASIITSRVSQGEFSEVIQHLAAGNLKPEAFISREMSGSEIQIAFDLLENEPEKYLKILIKIW